MPAYSFKERFVPFVKDGSKPGTIRAFRKYPPKVGQLAHLYYGMRTKFCTKLVDSSPVIKEVRCVLFAPWGAPFIIYTNWIEPQYRDFFTNDKNIIKYLDQHQEKGKPEFLNGLKWKQLTNMQDRNEFAWLDGFRHSDDLQERDGCFDIMYRWWKQTNGLPFLGNHIIWGEYNNCW